MDKKKIEKLIISARNRLINIILSQNKQEELTKINEELSNALEELSKSNWISVKDELPKEGVTVLVTNKKHPKECNLDYRDDPEGIDRDKYGFESYYGVTHWHEIDKLDV